jgi:hypothetical protein
VLREQNEKSGTWVIIIVLIGMVLMHNININKNQIEVIQKNPNVYSTSKHMGITTFYLNYTVPDNMKSATYKIKLGKEVKEIEIPKTCLNNPIVQLRVESWTHYSIGSYSAVSCSNGQWYVMMEKRGKPCGQDGSCSYMICGQNEANVEIAFDNNFDTGLISYISCNSFNQMNNNSTFYDEEMKWMVMNETI